MGIELLFNTLKDKNQKAIYKFTNKLNKSHIYIDFNSIIHTLRFEVKDKDDFEQKLLDKIVEYTINIFEHKFVRRNIKFIFIAIDGVPLKSKMVEQKKRRYISQIVSILKNDKYESWSNINISPGTLFMEKLSIELKKVVQHLNNNKNYPNLKEVIISDSNSHGEGEFKIIKHIQNYDFSVDDSIIVYSPDADMMLLVQIVRNDITLLRYNQQLKFYEVIENYVLFETFYLYILKHLNFKPKYNDIQNDLILLFTIFGNDFVPKLECINTGLDIDFIIDLYTITLQDTETHLIEDKKINNKFLLHFFKLLQKFETDLLDRNYYHKKYCNYKRSIPYNFSLDVKNPEKYKNNTDFTKYNNFHYNILKFVDRKDLDNPLSIYKLSLEDLLKMDLKYKKLPEISHYTKYASRPVHIKELHKTRDMTPNEQLTYAIENRLNSKYGNFYETMKANPIKVKRHFYNKQFTSIENACKEYLKGINWVYNYYFFGTEDYDLENAWFYKYSKAPLLDDLIKQMELNNYFEKLKTKKYSQDNFFRPIEHFVYVTPLLHLPKHILKTLTDLDLSKMEKYLVNLKKVNYDIDCSSAIFISKCEVDIVKNNLDNDKEFVKQFRKCY